MAGLSGKTGAVNILLGLGCDPGLKTPEGQTAGDLAEANIGQNMGAQAELNHALKNRVYPLRAAEADKPFVPLVRSRPVDDALSPDEL